MNHSVKQTIFVNALIHNANQEVLLVRRSRKDRFLPGYFELPGGRVELGESLEHALERKLDKELGIHAKTPLYYMSLAHIDSHGPYIRTAFEVAYDNAEPIALSPDHDEFIWFNGSDYANVHLASDTRVLVENYQGSSQTLPVDLKTTLTINTDGGSRGNPGPSASAFVIHDEAGKLLESGGAYIGITTNNQAEYTAVELALKAAERYAGLGDTVLFNIDSLLVVNQLNGVYKVKNRELWPINQGIHELIKKFGSVRFKHIPREQNIAADGKVNEILDQHTT
jgi:ribonuclease HI/ADP-ribose pyrophosphatase YjhB (NUDIX family)